MSIFSSEYLTLSHYFHKVVTGCTSGIGESFAKQLGKAGFNVLLVSRNKQVLDQLAQEIGMSCVHAFYLHRADINSAGGRNEVQGPDQVRCH